MVAWPPQLTMLTFISRLPTCSVEVDRRYAVGADRRGREIDHHHAARLELACVLGMHVRRGRIEGDADVVGCDVRQESVDAVGRGLEALLAGHRETLGLRIDADHPDRTDPLAAERLI